MAFEHRYTGERLVILATPTGGAELEITGDYTAFTHSFAIDNVDVTAGNEREKSKLTTKEDLTWSLDVFDGDSDTWNDFVAADSGYMEVYPKGLTGDEFFSFNYILESKDHSTGTDAAATLTVAGSRSGDMIDDFGSDPGGNRKLAFTVQPSNTVTGAKIANVTVQIQTFASVLVATDNSTLVTISIGTNPGDGVLSGVTSVRAVNGVAVFAGLIITDVGGGTGYTLAAANDKGYTAAISSTFNITT